MTLRENIEAMTKIANTADKDLHVAKDNLLRTISSNRLELMTLGEKMKEPSKYAQNTPLTFDSEYISLFMSAFSKIDDLLTKVMAEGAIPEGEFCSPDLEKIGIEYFPQGPVKKRIHVQYPDYDDVYSGEPVELRYAVSPTTETDVPVANWSSVFKTWIDTAALKCIKTDGDDYYMTAEVGSSPWAYSYFKVLPFASPAKATDGTSCMGYTFTTEDVITDPSTGCIGRRAIMVRDGMSLVQFGTDVKEAFVSYSNFGQFLYKFDKLLLGYFGTKATAHGMNALLEKFTRKASNNTEAEYYIKWFSKEAAEFSDTAAISAALSTPRAVEHAASLYAAKFALLRIMAGHAARLKF